MKYLLLSIVFFGNVYGQYLREHGAQTESDTSIVAFAIYGNGYTEKFRVVYHGQENASHASNIALLIVGHEAYNRDSFIEQLYSMKYIVRIERINTRRK